MGSFYQRWKKHLRFGIIFIATLSFGVPAAMAQQATGSDELLTRDGTRVADFERDTERGEEDQFDQPDQPRPQQVQQPQDPLNELYAGYSSQTIDRRDNERVSRPLRDPLNEAPRNFRDQDFAVRLLRGQQGQGGTVDENWRQRDDAAFDPLGTRIGGFVFYPELYSGLITSNNLFATRTSQKSDYALEITPTFRLRSDWNNHELELFATGTKTNWRNFISENTLEFETRVRGRIDITSRTSIEGGVRYEQAMEGRGSTELPDAASKPAKTHETEIFGQINHRFNRLGFRIRGQITRNIFDDVALNSGAIQDNSVRNYDEHELEVRTNYEFSPRLSLFVDSGLGTRKFAQELDGSGFVQGSKNWLVAVGANMELSPTLSFLGRIGYARANPDEASYVDLEGVIYDASLIWAPTRLMSATLRGETQIEETTQTGTPGSINRSVSLELANSWTHRLNSVVRSEFEHRDYAGIDQTDRELTLGLELEYLLSRSWVLNAGYEHTLVEGSNSYREDEFSLGVKWRR